MNKIKKYSLYIIIFSIIITIFPLNSLANIEVESPSYILMDSKTGTVLLSKNENDKRPLASVTKIMTMTIIMEELASGNLKLSDKIATSENASKMGGSQIFLKANEQMDVETLIKSIFVASANDASYAMAEHIAGSEALFVERMNKKAQELGLLNTNFKNPHGLDEDGHYSSAFDIAVISRELMKYPLVKNYTSIWQDKIRNGTFELTNTNKLIRFYEGANGLKTGSTGKAGFCISATAKRKNLELIAVTLGASTSNNRFSDAKALLDYGFSNYKNITLASKENEVAKVEIVYGKTSNISLYPNIDLDYLIKSDDKAKIDTVIETYPKKAPIKEGDVLGKISFTKEGKVILEANLITKIKVNKKTYFDVINDFLKII
jgi:D-alanyl-D-alanine carboxypeptidase (penicillin-binding protein 5/6)